MTPINFQVGATSTIQGILLGDFANGYVKTRRSLRVPITCSNGQAHPTLVVYINRGLRNTNARIL